MVLGKAALEPVELVKLPTWFQPTTRGPKASAKLIPSWHEPPFKMDYWRRNEEMKLAGNPDHFAKPSIEGILKIPYANVQGMVAGD